MSDKKSFKLFFLSTSVLAIGAFFPFALLLLALSQLLLIVVFIAGRQWSLRRSRDYSISDVATESSSCQSPFFSIQIATYSEPPDLVIQTLESLRDLEGAPYEVIVVDNNTSDPALYEPVRKFCAAHERLRFFHFDDVQGAKAGALNLVRAEAHKDATHFLILDADYVARPDLLRQAARHVGGADLALVQFPQSYRNEAKDCPLAHEYASFFDVYMTTAQESRSVLSTGTAAVVERSALEAVGGWPTTTITEDADLGLLFASKGYRTIYVHQPVARGLMPTKLSEFLKQRSRWIKGNLQCLGKHQLSDLPMEGRCSALLQLTAWVSPLVFYPLIVLIATYHAMFGNLGSLSDSALALANASAGLYIAFSAVFFFLSNPSRPTRAKLEALLVHLGTYWTSVRAVLEALSGRELRFERTGKEMTASEGFRVSRTPVLTILFCSLVGFLATNVSVHLGLAWLFLSLPSAGLIYLERVLHHIEKRSLNYV